METKLEKELRFLKIYSVVATLFFAVFLLTAFTLKSGEQKFEEIAVKRIKFVDSDGKERALIGADSGRGSLPGLLFYDEAGRARVRIGAALGKGSLAGLVFYNEEGTEAGALMHNGKRDGNGIDAASIFTMDQFKSDEVIRLSYEQRGDQKRHGLVISDRPDALSPQAEKLMSDLAAALGSAKSEAERDALRREYLSRLPAREILARRLFAGRDTEGASLVTLSDQDGKPRLQLKVDRSGQANIEFLDASGRVVRTIRP